MRCQICSKSEATIHLTEISEGVRREVHLCEHCAQEQGIAVKSQMPINELLSNLLAVQPSDEDLFGLADEQGSCPRCGFTLDEFRKEPLVGCPYDYEVFEKVLLPVIEKAHDGRGSHCGKVPSKTPEDTKNQIKVMTLRRQLDEAIRAEDYELAAKLRDEMGQTNVDEQVNTNYETE